MWDSPRFINISTLTNEGIDELVKELNRVNFQELKRVNKSLIPKVPFKQ